MRVFVVLNHDRQVMATFGTFNRAQWFAQQMGYPLIDWKEGELMDHLYSRTRELAAEELYQTAARILPHIEWVNARLRLEHALTNYEQVKEAS